MQRARQGGWPDHQDSRDNGSTAASEQLTFGLFLQSLELHKAFASRFCSLVFLHLRIVMAALWYRLPARIELIVDPSVAYTITPRP